LLVRCRSATPWVSGSLGPDGRKELERLLKRAEGGDPSVLRPLRLALDANPAVW
jgi:hypothetical protein